MEYLKQPANLKDKKTMATIIGTILLLFALPLTVIGTLQLKEGTPKLTGQAAAPPLDQMGFPRITNVNGVQLPALKYMVTSIACGQNLAEDIQSLRVAEPSMTVLRYFSGRAYQTNDDRSIPLNLIYPGHWLFFEGTTLSGEITDNQTSITVADGAKIADALNLTKFPEGQYAMIWDGEASGTNDKDDPAFWDHAEHVLVTGVSGNTVTLGQRGYRTTASGHPSGSRIAIHIGAAGQAVRNTGWAYNQSVHAPKDSNGKQLNQVMGEFLAANLNNCPYDTDPANDQHLFDGILFDVTPYFGPTPADVNNDLVADGGITTNISGEEPGRSSWGEGLEIMFDKLRQGLGPDKIITGGVIETRGFDNLNGNQFEGFPGNVDANILKGLEEIDGDFARYESWMEKAAFSPKYTEIYTRFPTDVYPDLDCPNPAPDEDCELTPPNSVRLFRYILGTAMLEDGFFDYGSGSGFGDYWWDEYAVDLETGEGQAAANDACDSAADKIACWKAVKSKTEYLGQPTGDRKYQRLFNPAPSDKIFEDSFEGGITANWTKTKANLSQAAGGAPNLGSNSLKITPTDSGAVATLSPINVEAGAEYTLKFWAKAGAIHETSVEIPNSVGGKEINQFLFFPTWKEYFITFTPTATTTSVRFKMLVETSDVFLDGVQIFKGGANKFRRDFDNGIVIVNGNSTPETFNLGGTFKKIKGTQDPINDGSLVTSITLEANDAIILLKVPDTENPTVTITSPTAGSTVSGTVSIQANATDNVGVTKVEFYVDGIKKSEDLAAPYSYSWDTNTVSNGSHTLTAKAYDAANNVGTSSTVSVNVNNQTTQVLTFTPTDDVTIVRDFPYKNFGSLSALVADGLPRRNFLIKFLVSGVTGRTVVSAKLRFYCFEPAIVGGIFYRTTNDLWKEGTITWSNAGATTTKVATLGYVAAGKTYDVDVSAFIKGNGVLSLAIATPSADGAAYYSKERGGVYVPKLIITIQ